MDQFYLIISVIAIILLILLLTVIGIMMKNQNVSGNYPPYQSQCPDYWMPNTDGTCSPNPNINKMSDINTYNPNSVAEIALKKNISVTVVGSGNSAQYKFDFTKNDICANKEWATRHNVEWDGVTSATYC